MENLDKPLHDEHVHEQARHLEKEKQRQELVAQINDVTGGKAGDLAEVLSYFPDTAREFLSTQTHAATVEGKKGVWYNVRHEQAGPGLKGERYEKGQMENLGVQGFTGESLFKVLNEINNLRGKGDLPKDYYDQSDDVTYEILRAVESGKSRKPNYQQAMILKALEVKGVTGAEIASMKLYAEATHESDLLNKKAAKLEEDAKKSRAESAEMIKEAREKIVELRELVRLQTDRGGSE